MSSFLAIRAIGSEFARRLRNAILVIVAIIAIVLVALLTWLVHVSVWWWLLAVPVGIFISVAIVVLGVLSLLIRFVRPAQSDEQKEKVSGFVDKLEFVQEVIGTPKFIILFQVIRSIAAPSDDSFLKNIIKKRNLHKDFADIVRGFSRGNHTKGVIDI